MLSRSSRPVWNTRISGLLRLNSTAAGAAIEPKRASLKNFLIEMYRPQQEPLPKGLPKELPKWQEALGEKTISFFNLDMDRIRAGRIGGQIYYELCRDQALFPMKKSKQDEPLSDTANFYYGQLGMPKTYNQWFQITSLHVWMLFVKMRCLPNKYCREYQQRLVDKLFEEMDTVMKDDLDISSGRSVNTYKKGLNDQLRGSVFAYDEAMAAGSDNVLAGALWRNLFGAEFEADFDKINLLLRYVRMNLYVLDQMSDVDFTRGIFRFLDPHMLYDPLTKAEEKDVRSAIEKYRQEAVAAGAGMEPSDKTTLSTEGL